MLFVYLDRPHVRKHGPAGYTTYGTFKPWLRDEFAFRCVYCLERERWYPSGDDAFGVDHIRCQSDPRNRELICDYENLLYACNRCNSAKRECLILNPCSAAMATHVELDEDCSLRPLTLEDRRLVNILGLNKPRPRRLRQKCLRVLRLFQKQPDDPEVRALYLDYFGYPDDLPNLNRLNPRDNTRPQGLADGYFRQREEGRLGEVYF